MGFQGVRHDLTTEQKQLWSGQVMLGVLEGSPLYKTLMPERQKARREGDDRGGDGWMASPPQWT